jgi:hypothetical protein
MENNIIAKQAMRWTPEGRKKSGSTIKELWRKTVAEYLEEMGMDWDKAEQRTGDRVVWQCCVAQCAGRHTWLD